MKEIREYYQSLTEVEQVVFIDLLNDLINNIDVINNIKRRYRLIPNIQKPYFEKYRKLFMENGFAKISGIMTYKKLDYSRSTEIQKYYNINLNVTFSKLAVLRKQYIKKIISFNIIQDLGIPGDIFYPLEEMLKEGLVIGEGKQKSFNLNYLEKENNIILEEIKKGIKPNEKKINILVFHLFLQEFALSYGEDQLDYELNQDKSFQETLFYIGNKEELKKLYSKLTGKEILQEKPLFFKKEGILKYGDKSIEFELYKLPYYLLCVIFEDEKNNGIDINDFNDYLISKQYNHSVEYEQMKNALKNINRRFKSKFKISKLLLVSNGKAIFKSKWLIL